MGVGNLTTQPVYPDENEVLNHDPLLVRHELKREKSADFVSQRSIDRVRLIFLIIHNFESLFMTHYLRLMIKIRVQELVSTVAL